MRANEFITEDLDEGLKSSLAAAGLGAAMALGGGYALYKAQPEPAQTKQQQKQAEPEIKPIGQPEELSVEDTLRQAAERAGIRGNELAQLMAQAAHETLDFKRMGEMGSQRYFEKNYDIRHNPRKARILGNTEAGDGVRYRGRGYLQITGRYNYRKAGAALGLPLEEKPELLEDPKIAARAAVWFWQHRVQPHVADFTNVRQSTRKINPGLHGLAQRNEKFAQYQAQQKDQLRPR